MNNEEDKCSDSICFYKSGSKNFLIALIQFSAGVGAFIFGSPWLSLPLISLSIMSCSIALKENSNPLIVFNENNLVFRDGFLYSEKIISYDDVIGVEKKKAFSVVLYKIEYNVGEGQSNSNNGFVIVNIKDVDNEKKRSLLERKILELNKNAI